MFGPIALSLWFDLLKNDGWWHELLPSFWHIFWVQNRSYSKYVLVWKSLKQMNLISLPLWPQCACVSLVTTWKMMASIETMAGHIFCYALLLRVLRWEFLITVFGRLLLVKYTLDMIIMDRKFDFATCHKASGFDLGT